MRTKALLLDLAAWGGLFTVSYPALGQSWTLTSAPTNWWYSVASSADGTKLVAVGNPSIYTSTNSGATWMLANAPANSYSSVASSDGTKCVAVVLNGGIYTSAPDQALSTLTSSDGRMVVAWSASAPGFRLQQNSDLTTTDWTDVTSAPTVTNLQNQLILVPAPIGNNFYRLKHL